MFSFNLYFGRGDLKKIVWAYPSSLLRDLLRMSEAVAEPVEKNVVLKQQTIKGIKVGVNAYLGKAVLTMPSLASITMKTGNSKITPKAISKRRLKEKYSLTVGRALRYSVV